MKYIGNKTRVINFIEDSLKKEKIDYNHKKIIDLFAGTGSVSTFFLKNGSTVYSCDNMLYSICEQYRVNFFSNEPDFKELSSILDDCSLDGVLKYLNNMPFVKGYFYDNYAPSGKYGRKYFSDENAMKIDAIRSEIENWKELLSNEKFLFLLGILMCAADKVSNTSGTYGAYLKIWRSMALKKLVLEKPEFLSNGKNVIELSDVVDFVKKYKKVDIVYMDPPYNKRQYASNFHVLENIVAYDKQELKGKTGLRDYSSQKSDYCIKNKVKKSFQELVDNIDTRYLIMSYSTEGLLSVDDILEVLNKKGKTNIFRYNYRRFKTNAWTDRNTNLQELLFVCRIC
jgi:adenine-specific DNA-methyltransferase